jgi:hypothetical protein
MAATLSMLNFNLYDLHALESTCVGLKYRELHLP